MLSLLQRHPLATALSALAVVLALVIALEAGLAATLQAALTAPVRRAAPFEAKLLPAPEIAQAEQLYPETAARPLFVPARRPAPKAEAPSTYTAGQFILQGVIVVGNNRTALLREKASGKIYRAEQGKEINGIKVAEINPEGVVLTQGTEREVVGLQVLKPPGAAGAAPGMPGAPAPGGGPFGPAAGTQTAQPGFPQPAPVPGGVPMPPAGGPPGVPPGGPIPGQAFPLPPGMTNPLAAPAQATSAAPAAEQAMTPEELLARRRARRGQQTQ